MAVGFQRRNVGLLTEMPQGGMTGTEAFRDFTQAPVAEAMRAAAEPADAEVLPPEMDDTQRAEAAAAQLIAAAEKQRKAAGNPLNRILSGVGGVIGAPFAFLDAALNGGDMSQVTAPFRPQQNADMRFAQTVLGIQDTLSKIRENRAQMQASQAQAIRSAMQTRREENDAAYADLGRLAGTTLYVDPTTQQNNWRAGLADLVDRYPTLKPLAQNIQSFDPTLAARLIGMTKDESANKLYQEYAYGSKQTPLGDGLGVTTYSRPGVAPSVYGPGMSVSGLPPITIGGAPPPAAPPPAAVAAPAAGDMTAPVNVRDFANIPFGNPLDPNIGSLPNVRRPVTPGAPAPAAPPVDFSKMTNEQLDAFIAAQGGQ